MLNHTLDQIAALKFHGLKAALLEQLEQPGAYTEMSFEERISHLIDREVLDRRNRRTQRMLGISKLKHKSVFPEDVDYQAPRNLQRSVLQSLFQNRWLQEHHKPVPPGQERPSWPVSSVIRPSCQATRYITPAYHR